MRHNSHGRVGLPDTHCATWCTRSGYNHCNKELGVSLLSLALPRPSIGAENLPDMITAQGSAVAQQPTRRRRALDCDLARRDDARHGGRATPRLTAWRGAGCCVTAGHHRPGGGGDGRPVSAAAPGSVRTREGAASADTQARAVPHLPPPPSAWWCGPQFALSQPAISRPAVVEPGCGPALACRRRALEAVEKVVTGPTAYSHK
jgi:hypothetical protein